MLNTKTRLGGDDNTATFAKVSRAVFTENSHTKGGRENFTNVNVLCQPSLCPYYYVRFVNGYKMMKLGYLVFYAAKIY